MTIIDLSFFIYMTHDWHQWVRFKMGYIKIRPSDPEYGVKESKFNLNFLHVSRTVKPSDDDI